MYQLYYKYRERDLIFIVPLVLLTLAKILRHFFWRLYSGQGFPQSADSKWYIDYANALIANFKDGLDMNDILYFGYNILLTLLLAVFRDPIFVIFIQGVTAGLSVILVYKIANMLFNRTTAIIASLFYCYVWDITLWSLYILSDSFFTSLLLLCVYFLLKAFETGQKRYKILFMVAAAYMVVFRPTGILTMVVMMIYAAVRMQKQTLTDFLKAHGVVIGAGLAAFATASVYFYTSNAFDPFLYSLQYNAKKVLYNVYAKGWVYDIPTAHDYYFKSDYKINRGNSLVLSYIINNWDHVLIVYKKRAIAFLGTWVWKTNLTTFSGILIFAGNLIPAALFLTGTIAAIRNGLFRKASIVWLVILSVFAFCILLFIDAMYRYRLPAIPFIVIAAAYGAERLIHAAGLIMKKYTGMRLYRGKWENTDCHSGF